MELKLIDSHTFQYNNRTISDNELIELIKKGAFEQFVNLSGNSISISTDLNNNFINPLQIIYIGSPGTGKSFKINNIVKKYYPEHNNINNISPFIFRTVIHEEYSYSDFVGSIMPTIKKSDNKDIIEYSFVPGIFTLSLLSALTNPNKQIFLIIEEMSRGNIASIFGDLFQLLDRDSYGRSEYFINNLLINNYLKNNINDQLTLDNIKNGSIYLPSNFNILGTINSSDQNVFVTDTAFKRRFELKYIDTNPIIGLNDYQIKFTNISTTWNRFYQILNKFIVKVLKLDEDKQIGQFFLKFKIIDEKENDNKKNTYINTWNNSQYKEKLMIYLWQDIQESSIFTDKKLFLSNIYSVQDLLRKVKNNEYIFSDEFINFYNNEEQNESKNS